MSSHRLSDHDTASGGQQPPRPRHSGPSRGTGPDESAPGLEPGEVLLAEFRPDQRRYWRDHGILAAFGTAGAWLVLRFFEVPHAEIGAVGAAAAVAVRASYLAPETLALVWRLTDRRLLLPDGRAFGLAEIDTVRPLLGDLQVITRLGDKHVIRHLADAERVIALIQQARARRLRRKH